MYYYIFIFCLIYSVNSLICSWSEWSDGLSCQWVGSHCLLSYKRTCICSNNEIGQGILCGNTKFYIETKPYVSNYHNPKNTCYKTHCNDYTNWCEWGKWTKWSVYSNTTCKRSRFRKCCKSHPTVGYTLKLGSNRGCFIAPTNQSNRDDQFEFADMNCHDFFIKWKKVLIYISIGVGSALLLLALCLITRSSKLKSEKVQENKIPLNDIKPVLVDKKSIDEVIKNDVPEPTAPVVEPPKIVVNPPPPATMPTTPPPYNSIFNGPTAPLEGPSGSTNVVVDQSNVIPEKEKKFEEVVSEIPEPLIVTTPVNVALPPPTYQMYARNRNLFDNS